ncbi:restriction endonuclease subunit S [Bifidobacterium scaligerum]|uniref:Type I restriction modification DNA specificity domain-containing protein n=1 Tax=Bifidobacterium scaligerum TaxID=2052656 RepID=A0A2M9HST6_9BIFI|nr:restriction endonuclease subunit S [Bifidobacterium scaligerum]PJM79848.1 hypothetical protein CUU80_01525 [Bifidobacterium scaligerum]
MGCKWNQEPLREFVSDLFKGVVPIYIDEGHEYAVPVIGQRCVRNYEIDLSPIRFHNGFSKPIPIRKMLRKHDILINATGVGSAGRVAQIRDDIRATIDGHVIVVRAQKIDPMYLGYALKCQQSKIEQLAEGSTGQTEMNKQRLQDEIIISYPNSIVDQLKIVHILNSIDRQIVFLNQANGHLLELLSAKHDDNFSSRLDAELRDVCVLVKEKTTVENANLNTYVSTESLIPDKGGRQRASGLPQSGKVTVYKSGDILISNIRPYFKKIWFADCNGTCSNDVLVFRAKDENLAPYIFFTLYSDVFFRYMVAGSKGTKMPRGDRNQIMSYNIPIISNEARAFSNDAKTVLNLISNNTKEIVTLEQLRDALLPKLMSGEIDVSKVELPTPPEQTVPTNGRLSD